MCSPLQNVIMLRHPAGCFYLRMWVQGGGGSFALGKMSGKCCMPPGVLPPRGSCVTDLNHRP